MSASCSSCRGQCCYNALIRVSGDDIRRIRLAQQLAVGSFVAAVPDTGRANDALAVSFVLGAPPRPHLLTLRHSARTAGACTFLLLLGNHQPCGVYEHRPMVCRVYPMQAAHGSVGVREDVICRPDYWDAAAIDAPAWRALIRERDAEWRTYARVAAVWNAACAVEPAGGVERYFDFLNAAYDAIAARRSAAAPNGELSDAAIDQSARAALAVAA